jgi:hypothetical protein
MPAAATATRPVKAGSMYEVLGNLSMPRPNDPDKQTDLLGPGDTVMLTDEQARPWLHRRIGPPMIRPIKEAGRPMPKIVGRDLSGGLRGPMVGARNDPKGSSIVIETRRVPESDQPMTEQDSDGDVDAIDIPPRGAAEAAAAAVTGE